MEDPMTAIPSRSVACLLAWSVALPACGDLSDVPAVVVHVDYRPDGQLVVFTSGGVKTYQGDFDREIGSFPIEGDDPYALQYKGTHLTDDGQAAAVTYGNQNNRTALYRIPDGALLGSLQPTPPVAFVALSPQGDLVFAYGDAPRGDSAPRRDSETLYRLADGTALWSVDYVQSFAPAVYCGAASGDPPPPVFTPDGTTMFLGFGEHLMTADVASGAMREIATVHACIGGLTLLPDGTLLVLHGLSSHWGYPGLYGAPLTNPDLPDAALPNSFAIYAQDGTLMRQLPPLAGYYTSATIWATDSPIYCSPVGDRCAVFAEKPEPVTAADGTQMLGGPLFVLVFGLDGTLLYTIPAPATGTAAFSPDGSRLALAFTYSEDPTSSAHIYRADDGTLLAKRTYTRGVF
jgi:hypothetical protein